ncbi:hypothetical protein MUK42_33784 [Musa troglodytarum]|uniref:Uncharacterized protein n=1 Tax=Musa troglodytarum TaxID=320322 RepID=A0A9E7J9X3_9LILI|nr:hypothetical protein MUK42_33784 [Musa troglodytarum]
MNGVVATHVYPFFRADLFACPAQTKRSRIHGKPWSPLPISASNLFAFCRRDPIRVSYIYGRGKDKANFKDRSTSLHQ